eukprot:6480872-Amphidinium_carterae.1
MEASKESKQACPRGEEGIDWLLQFMPVQVESQRPPCLHQCAVQSLVEPGKQDCSIQCSWRKL